MVAKGGLLLILSVLSIYWNTIECKKRVHREIWWPSGMGIFNGRKIPAVEGRPIWSALKEENAGGLPMVCDFSGSAAKIAGALSSSRKNNFYISPKEPILRHMSRAKVLAVKLSADDFKEIPKEFQSKIEDAVSSGDLKDLSVDAFKEIPKQCIRSLKMKDLSAAQVTEFVKQDKGDLVALRNLMSGVKSEDIGELIENIKQIEDMPLSAIKSLSFGAIEKIGGVDKLNNETIHTLGPEFVLSMSPNQVKKLKKEQIDIMLGVINEDLDFDLAANLMPQFRAFTKRIFQVHKSANDVETFTLVRYFIPLAPLRILKGIGRDVIGHRSVVQGGFFEALNYYCNAEDITDPALKRFIQNILKEFPNVRRNIGVILETVVMHDPLAVVFFLMEYQGMAGCLPKKVHKAFLSFVTCDMMAGVLKSLNTDVFERRLLKQVYEECRPDVPYQNMTVAELTGIGPLLSSVPLSEVKHIPEDNLCNPNVEKLFKGAKRNVKKYVMKKCMDDFDNRLVEMDDSFAEAAALKEWRAVPKAILKSPDVKAKLSKMARQLKRKKKGGKAALRAIAKNFKSNITELMTLGSKELVASISRKEFCESADIDELMGIDVDLTDAQSKCLMKKLKASKPPNTLTPADIRQSKGMVRGFVAKDIKAMNPEDRIGMSAALCEQENWPIRPVMTITRNLIVKGLQELNDTSYMEALTAEVAEGIGGECWLHLSVDEIKKTANDVCQLLCRKIGQASAFQLLPKDKRVDIKRTCLECILADRVSKILTDQDLSILGKITAELKSSELDSQVDKAAFQEQVPLLIGTCRDKAFNDKLAEMLTSSDMFGDPANWTCDRVGGLSELVTTLSTDDLMKIPKDCLVESALNIIHYVDLEEETQVRYHKMCVSGLSQADIQDLGTRKSNIKQAIFKAVIGTAGEELVRQRRESADRRRKRDASSWTCDDISAMGSSVTQSTVSDLETIPTAEFVDCLETLGSVSGWSTSQRDALMTRVRNDINEVCKLSTDEVGILGSMALSLTVNEITCVDISTDDTVAVLGSYHEWSKEQLTALVDAFLGNRSLSDASDFTTDHVTTLGHILCGTDLSKLDSEVFANTSSLIGDLKACPLTQLQTLKNIAKDAGAYGSIDTWDASVLSDIGIVAGGLVGSELSSLSEDSMEGLRTIAIPNIPADDFKALSISQLAIFSPEQAEAVTEAQRNVLAWDKYNALMGAQYGENADPYTVTPPPEPTAEMTTSVTPSSASCAHDWLATAVLFFNILKCLLHLICSS